ncbi:MAG: hypothetical protein R2710_06995 [Acidimicrobiales bacterium]
MAGLIDQIGDLEAALALTAELATLAPLTLRYIKQTVDAVAKGLESATTPRSWPRSKRAGRATISPKGSAPETRSAPRFEGR